MKNVILSFLLLSFTSLIFAQDSIESDQPIRSNGISKHVKWQKSFEKAQKLALRKNKPLLVFFTGSDWCGPCKNLHKDFFESDKFIEIAGKEFILYEADFPRRRDIITEEKKKENKKIQREYGVRGYPTILVLSSQGIELGRHVGYSFMRDPEPHFKLLEETLLLNP